MLNVKRLQRGVSHERYESNERDRRERSAGEISGRDEGDLGRAPGILLGGDPWVRPTVRKLYSPTPLTGRFKADTRDIYISIGP
jgi:hypothetical protein